MTDAKQKMRDKVFSLGSDARNYFSDETKVIPLSDALTILSEMQGECEFTNNGNIILTECGESVAIYFNSHQYKFCPFCGKEIKEAQDD